MTWYQGSITVPFSCLGQVDFLAGLVMSHSHLPVSHLPSEKKSKLRFAQGKQNLRAAGPEGISWNSSFSLD